MKLSTNSKSWRLFRINALIIVVPFLIGVLWSVISYFSGRRSIEVAGLERFYHIHLPPGYDENDSMPLLLVFHRYWVAADSIKNASVLASPVAEVAVFNGPEGGWTENEVVNCRYASP